MSIYSKNSILGISVCDISTGDLYSTKIDGLNVKYKLGLEKRKTKKAK